LSLITSAEKKGEIDTRPRYGLGRKDATTGTPMTARKKRKTCHHFGTMIAVTSNFRRRTLRRRSSSTTRMASRRDIL